MIHDHLAWHETLDMHELVAFQTAGLFMLKKSIKMVHDPKLRELYKFSIHSLKQNLTELLAFYPETPKVMMDSSKIDETPFYAGNLLGLAKTAVRNYAIAITETATPALRKVLTKQLKNAVKLHGKVYYYMYQKGYYPSYDLNQLLANDYMNATKAIQLEY
ncbi:spore coat protein [Thermoflavimicrobium daqui]|uniref:Spore coat protein n=1 Tax=Thermoflavimicrobium daqui TaxID=2137476 RepID=A0A364K686_9BACL|nr:spore coat protein [Thermoflavimicrobium daqui]RAL25797.1 spore coat protein [Thermoflavimicrobium daqui]